jgi:N6-adenosine-specific RNA methylase IME4
MQGGTSGSDVVALNPSFCEALAGLPAGWTDPQVPQSGALSTGDDSKPSETPWSPPVRKSSDGSSANSKPLLERENNMQKYGVIAADPSWQFGDRLTMSDVPRGSASNYEVMTAEDIVQLDVRSVAADDAVLLLWCPAALISTGLCTMESWGFQMKQIWTWVKTGRHEERLDSDDVPEDLGMAFGMGRLARNACEFALVGTRGKIYPHLQHRGIRNVFLAPSYKHSEKPWKVAEALELMFPDFAKLELFARRARPGWTTIGLEVPGDPRDVRDFVKSSAAA